MDTAISEKLSIANIDNIKQLEYISTHLKDIILSAKKQGIKNAAKNSLKRNFRFIADFWDFLEG